LVSAALQERLPELRHLVLVPLLHAALADHPVVVQVVDDDVYVHALEQRAADLVADRILEQNAGPAQPSPDPAMPAMQGVKAKVEGKLYLLDKIGLCAGQLCAAQPRLTNT
jgi:hypothetical protein